MSMGTILGAVVAIVLILSNLPTIQKYVAPAMQTSFNQTGEPNPPKSWTDIGTDAFNAIKENIMMPLWLLVLIIVLILILK